MQRRSTAGTRQERQQRHAQWLPALAAALGTGTLVVPVWRGETEAQRAGLLLVMLSAPGCAPERSVSVLGARPVSLAPQMRSSGRGLEWGHLQV